MRNNIILIFDWQYKRDTILCNITIHLFILIFQNDGHIGDKFLNLIEPFAAETPYMTCPGNHEHK
jgi:hypothetical protein